MPRLISQLKQKAIALKREVTALYFAYRDKRTPWYARIFVALVVSYALSPIDLIPDFIPIIGYLDDLVLVPLGISLALKMIPTQVMIDARQKASDPIQNKSIGLIFTIIIIIIWVLLILVFISTLAHLFSIKK